MLLLPIKPVSVADAIQAEKLLGRSLFPAQCKDEPCPYDSIL
jgi:hypothetical protein